MTDCTPSQPCSQPDCGYCTPEPPRLTAVAASAMTMRAAKWLYHLRIPAGAITLLAGREGIGKSTISYDIVSKVTRGALEGRYLGRPRSVAVVATEDAWAEVILPRLVAARADLDRVYRIDAHTDDGTHDQISVPADLNHLAKLCATHDIALVVLDPLMSVVHGSIDTHKDREVRKAIDPLAKFAATNNIAVLGLIHTNKAATADPLNSIMASRAFTAAARSVLYCIVDPEADSEDRYLFGHPKSNLGPKQPSIKYHLTEVKIELDPDQVDEGDDPIVVTSRVVWDGDDDRSIRDVMETPRERSRPDSEPTIRILEWIRQQGRTVAAKELHAEFSDIKRGTLDKHLTRLVDRGKLIRPIHGHYSVGNRETTESQSGTQSGTPSTSTLMPEVPEVPDRQDLLALPADLASRQARRPGARLLPEPFRTCKCGTVLKPEEGDECRWCQEI